MSLRSQKIEFGKMDVVKAMAYAAVTYSIGHEIIEVANAIANPAPVVADAADSWKAFFEGIKTMPALKIGVQFVALAYLGQDLMNSRKPSSLRSGKIEVFGSPMVKSLAVGSVAALVGSQIATAALTVGPFYAPLVTDGVDAFLGSLPMSPEAREAVFNDVESPFSLDAIAVFAAYRYVRHDFIPAAVKGALCNIRSMAASVVADCKDGIGFEDTERQTTTPAVPGGRQHVVENTDFISSRL